MSNYLATSPALPRRTTLRAARGEAPTMGALFARLLLRVAALVRSYARHVQRRRQAAATCRALAALDPGALHDLGFDASEIDSVAAEVSGQADVTRARVAQTRGCAVARP